MKDVKVSRNLFNLLAFIFFKTPRERLQRGTFYQKLINIQLSNKNNNLIR